MGLLTILLLNHSFRHSTLDIFLIFFLFLDDVTIAKRIFLGKFLYYYLPGYKNIDREKNKQLYSSWMRQKYKVVTSSTFSNPKNWSLFAIRTMFELLLLIMVQLWAMLRPIDDVWAVKLVMYSWLSTLQLGVVMELQDILIASKSNSYDS